MFSDVEMHDAAALVSQHDEHEEHPAGDGWDGEEITGNQVLDMVVQERFPRWRGRLTDLWPILLHRRFGDIDAKLPQLPDNARRAPRRIRLPHILDQLADLFHDGRSSRLAALTAAVANNCGIASSARRSRSGVARMPGPLANPATGARATPRVSDRWAEASGGRRSVCRRQLDGAER